MGKIKIFFTTGIWRIRKNRLPRAKSFFLHHLRIIVLALRGFAEDKCPLRASALTFFSLLSIVPVFAMAFGIAKGFGFEKKLESLALTGFKGQEEVLSRVIDFARRMLENTSGGLVAGIGVALLFWSVIKVLGNIETAFNEIWGVKTSRSMVRKFSDYISIMLIAPVLLIAASSATVFVQSRITGIVAELSILGPLAALLLLAIRFLPYCVLWILFSFIYVVMPNTRVHVKSGVFAGIVAGTIFQLWQGLYIVMQIGASKYGAIYGSFAALPLFLTWLQISWIIVLLGAEFSFAHQNVDTYELEPDCLAVSPGFKKTLSVWIAGLVVKRFVAGDEPWTANRISREREIPIRLVNEILYDLAGARVLAPVRSGDEKMDAYVPAQDPERLTVAFVLDALDSSGRETLPIPAAPELEKIQNAVRAMRDRIRELPQNMLLKEM